MRPLLRSSIRLALLGTVYAAGQMILRSARTEDAPALTRIAFAAKAHWGYCAAQMDIWRAAITISAQSIAEQPAVVAEHEGAVVGFYQFELAEELPQLDHLWVHPAYMGRGFGRALLQHAREWLKVNGHAEAAIDADPYAEAFYLSQGARRMGEVAAPIEGEPNRVRPQMRLPAIL